MFKGIKTLKKLEKKGRTSYNDQKKMFGQCSRAVGMEAPLTGVVTSPFLVSLGQFISWATMIYVWIIIIRVLLTWINPNPYSPVMRLLSKAVDPVLAKGRQSFPLVLGGLDFSPILVIMIIQLAGALLGRWLWALGMGAPAIVLLPLVILSLVSLIDSIAWLLVLIMAVRLVMGLVHPSPYNLIVQIIYGLTEPLLAPLRRFFPPSPNGFDFRPLVFLLVIILIQQVVLKALAATAAIWLGGFAAGA